MPAFKLSLLTLAATAVLTAASLRQRVRSCALYQWSTRKVLEALRRSATGTGIVTAIVRIIGGMDITDRYRPYYGYPLDLETYSVWRNKRPSWFDY